MPKASMLRVRRVLTETPLARQHEKTLARGDRQQRPEPRWAAFDRAAHPEVALSLAHDFHRNMVVGEYMAVEIFSGLASALAKHGAPLDLVGAATRTASDELRHTDFCLRFASLCAGENIAVDVEHQQPGALSAPRPTLEEVDAIMVEVVAIGETLAAALLAGCRRRATEPLTHALLTSIGGDEVHHARLGWYYLAWRAPQWSSTERQRLADLAGHVLVEIEPRFWIGRDAPAKVRPAAAALGILDSPSQRMIVKSIMQDEIVPGLDALGLGASHAWRVRKRGKA